MKKTAFLLSSALLTIMAAVLTLMYSPNIIGLVISIISAFSAIVVFYCAVVSILQHLKEQNNEKLQMLEKMQSVYSGFSSESINMITQLTSELSKQLTMNNENVSASISALETSIKESIASHGKNSSEQSRNLIEKIEAIDAEIVQCHTSGKTLYKATAEQIFAAIQEIAKRIEETNQNIQEQVSECSSKTTRENLEIANQLSTVIKLVEASNDNTECTANNVKAVSAQLESSDEHLKAICTMLVDVLNYQDESKRLLTDISETIATDASITAFFDNALRKIDRLIDEQKKSNRSVSDATTDMENVLDQLRQTLLANDESLRKALEQFVLEYSKLSSMDAQLIKSVLAKK